MRSSGSKGHILRAGRLAVSPTEAVDARGWLAQCRRNVRRAVHDHLHQVASRQLGDFVEW